MRSNAVRFLLLIVGSVRDLAPIIVVIGFFQLVVLQQPIPNLGEILIGVMLVLLGLTLTPPLNSDDDFALTVSATSTEGEGGSATSVATFNVDVTGVADVPVVNFADARGVEDVAIPLDVSAALADLDGSETITAITVDGVPDGAVLSAGTDNGNGTWSLDLADLTGLTITAPPDSSDDFFLNISVTATEASGDSATKSVEVTVDVSGIADAPNVDGVDVTGIEDTAIPLNIGIEFADTDGSESLTVTIGGVPDGATLNIGGVDVAPDEDGTITIAATPAEIAEISITPPENFSGEIPLSVVATTSEDGTDASGAIQALDDLY